MLVLSSLILFGLSQPTLPLPALSVGVTEMQRSVSVPPGTQRVPFLTLELKASCAADIEVFGVKLLHRGMGDSRDLSSVYAMSDGRRISRGREISASSAVADLSFRDFFIPACGSRTIVVEGDFSPDAALAGEHRLELSSPSDVLSTASASEWIRTRSLNSGVFRTAGESQGLLRVEALPVLQTATYGEGRFVGRFRLTNADTRDQLLLSLTLTNKGSARDLDLRNLWLQNAGRRVSSILPSLSGRIASFTLDSSLLLPRGSVFLIDVRGDIRASIRKTIRFSIEEPSDVVSRRSSGRR